jgi:hypothetical protein
VHPSLKAKNIPALTIMTGKFSVQNLTTLPDQVSQKNIIHPETNKASITRQAQQ